MEYTWDQIFDSSPLESSGQWITLPTATGRGELVAFAAGPGHVRADPIHGWRVKARLERVNGTKEEWLEEASEAELVTLLEDTNSYLADIGISPLPALVSWSVRLPDGISPQQFEARIDEAEARVSRRLSGRDQAVAMAAAIRQEVQAIFGLNRI